MSDTAPTRPAASEPTGAESSTVSRPTGAESSTVSRPTGAESSTVSRPTVPPSVREALPGTLMERLGIEILEASPARVVGTMPVAGNTQPYGLLHGGASVVLAETLGSFGAMLHAGEGRIAVGIEVNASHHRSAREGVVTGTATPVHLGSSSAVYDVVIVDSRSRRVCTARLTCRLLSAGSGD